MLPIKGRDNLNLGAKDLQLAETEAYAGCIVDTVDMTADRIHKCTICDKIYKKRRILLRHMACHSEKTRFGCGRCQKYFESEDLLLQHNATHKQHLCYKCGKSFATKHNLKRHSVSHGETNQVTIRECPVPGCDRAFARKYKFDEHLASFHGGKRVSCTKCARLFKTKEILKKHEIVCFDVSKGTCHVCGSVFSREDALQRHIDAQHNGKKFICSCGQVFSYFGSLSKHRQNYNHK